MSGSFAFPQDRRQSSRAQAIERIEYYPSLFAPDAPNDNTFDDRAVNSPGPYFISPYMLHTSPYHELSAPVPQGHQTVGLPLQQQLANARPTNLPFRQDDHNQTFGVFNEQLEGSPNLEWALHMADTQVEVDDDDWVNTFTTLGSYDEANAFSDSQQNVGVLRELTGATPTPATLSLLSTNMSRPTEATPTPRGRQAIAPMLGSDTDVEPSGSKLEVAHQAESEALGDNLDTVVASGKKPRRKSQKQVNEVNEPPSPPLRSSGLYFSDVRHSRQQVNGLSWGPRLDDTLPTSQEEREAIVKELFIAMQDMSSIQDKKSGLMLKKRWLGEAKSADTVESSENGGDARVDESEAAQRVASNEVYKPWVKERVCWELLVSGSVLHAPVPFFQP